MDCWVPDAKILELKARLLGSLLLFTQFFYKARTGSDFIISQPISRESHHIIICRELTRLFKLQSNRLIINVAPGSGKSELCRHFIAWCIAHYPDSNFIYVSITHQLAAKSTSVIRDIITLPLYRKLFNVYIDDSSSAKDNFRTTVGGGVYAAGAEGTIVGFDAGLPDPTRFTGGYIMDDMHDPDKVTSDTVRNSAKEHFFKSGMQRRRNPKAFFLFIGQRVHEDDLPAALLNGDDGHVWDRVILKSLDDANNPLQPNVHSKEDLLIMKETKPYVFWSQHQQEPIPAGGSLFLEKWFPLLDNEPDVFCTFITIDTAETSKSYNDATVFSFWGVYRVQHHNVTVPVDCLYWIDCVEVRIEPKDLESEFWAFYANCMRYRVKPKMVGIEKKSTGTTLVSVLKNKPGLRIHEIERTRASGSKCDRFIKMQPYVASNLITLPVYGKHTAMCITHMSKITANNSHRFDDICDTASDATEMALIDKIVYVDIAVSREREMVAKEIMMPHNKLIEIRKNAFNYMNNRFL